MDKNIHNYIALNETHCGNASHLSKDTRIRLNTGHTIPIIGLGTYTLKDGEAMQAVDAALDAGYRHFDTAYAYENEIPIGQVIARRIQSGKITRHDLFITSKLWNTFHRPNLVRRAFYKTLHNLQMNYIDLYLIHTPCSFRENTGEIYPRNDDRTIQFSDVNLIDTWMELKRIYDEGFAKNVGVSNFNIKQMKEIVQTGFIPAVLQIECNPFCVQPDLLNYCRSYGIHVTSHSPLGTPTRLIGFSGLPILLNNKIINEIAQSYVKTPAQIVIRYQMQKGNSVIPKSSRPERIRANIDVFDFFLTEHDMRSLDNLDVSVRCCPLLDYSEHKNYPFDDCLKGNKYRKRNRQL
jgi:aldehyde reductase